MLSHYFTVYGNLPNETLTGQGAEILVKIYEEYDHAVTAHHQLYFAKYDNLLHPHRTGG